MTLASTATAHSAPLTRPEAGRLLGHTMGLVALTAVSSRSAPTSAATLFGRGEQRGQGDDQSLPRVRRIPVIARVGTERNGR
jgi:hypothetical protein